MKNAGQTGSAVQPPVRSSPGGRRFASLLKLLICTLPVLTGAANGTLKIAWDANTESDLAGYYLYWDTVSGNYNQPRVLIPKTQTTYALTGLDPSLIYFVALKAFDTANNESDFSNEASGLPTVVVCGDGSVGAGEGCDDGNILSGDGCSSTCQREVCGNRILDANEQCDDGNTSSGDGCSSTCRLELASPLVSGALDTVTGTKYLMRCSEQTIRVTGSNFRSGATVSFVDTSISVTSTRFVNSIELTATVRAASGTTLGGKPVRVTNPDGSSGTSAALLEVVKNPDFSRNGQVGAEDINDLAIAFGSVLGGLNFNPDADMNGDNLVDGKDLSRFTPFLGWTVTSCP